MKRQQNYWETVWILAKTDFKLRYHGSWLGFLWVILKPLSIFAILNFVFSHVFGGGVHFSLGLLTAIILWGFFAEGTMVGMTSLLQKAHIITKIYIPKWVIVIAATLNTLLNFMLNLVILAVFFIWAGFFPPIEYVCMFFYYCVLTYFLIASFSFLTAPLFLKFRDLNQIWEVLLTAGFYAAPIIYPLSILPSNIQTILYFNPMTFIIVQAKLVLIEQQYVFLANGLLYSGIVFICLICSYLFFQFTSKRVAENM